MSAILERAEDVVAEITGNLIAAAIDNATVTLDLLQVPAALPNGPAVVVQPPRVEYTATMAGSVTDATWEVFVIAGPVADRLAAWRTIDKVMDALKDPMNIDSAEPATFTHPGLADHPAYVLSFTEPI
jgi:hypothetical protein